MVDFEKYRGLAAKLNETANAAWLKINGLTVAEIINGEVDLQKLDRAVMDLSTKCSDANRALSREMDRLSDEDEDRLYDEHMDVDNLLSGVDDKFSMLDSIISNLKSIQDDCEEGRCADKFSDVQTINLGESIKIQRFNYFV